MPNFNFPKSSMVFLCQFYFDRKAKHSLFPEERDATTLHHNTITGKNLTKECTDLR